MPTSGKRAPHRGVILVADLAAALKRTRVRVQNDQGYMKRSATKPSVSIGFRCFPGVLGGVVVRLRCSEDFRAHTHKRSRRCYRNAM